MGTFYDGRKCAGGREDVGHIVKLLSDRMRAACDLDLRARGLTFGQANVLHYLSEHGGEASQKDIESYLNVAHPTVAGLIQRLEKGGFVVSRGALMDRRCKIISLTPRAIELSSEIKLYIRQREMVLLAGLDADKVRELYRMLLIMLNNLAKDETYDNYTF